MVLIEFECSIEVLKKIIESESGFFKKSSETPQSLTIQFFEDCRSFCDQNLSQPQTYFLTYAASSIDAAVRTTSSDPLNLIQYRQSGSMLDKRIMEDWLLKNNDRTGFAPHFLCLLAEENDAEKVIEPILESTDSFKGKVVVSLRDGERVRVSTLNYPDFRLDGDVIGGVEYNYTYNAERHRLSLHSQLKEIPFFVNGEISLTPESKPEAPTNNADAIVSSSPEVAPRHGYCDVVITSNNQNPVETIKILRQALDIGLKEAKDIADNLPTVAATDVLDWRAEELRNTLEQKGFGVELKPSGGGASTSSSSKEDITVDGITILSCDIEVFAFRNDKEHLSQNELAAELIKTVGTEVENSLSASESPSVIDYSNSSCSLTNYEQVTSSEIGNFISDGTVNLVVRDITGYDWDSALIYLSGDANARILAIGKHPLYDRPVRQIYDCGELDTGIIEDRDLDLYGSDDVAQTFNGLLRL